MLPLAPFVAAGMLQLELQWAFVKCAVENVPWKCACQLWNEKELKLSDATKHSAKNHINEASGILHFHTRFKS